MATNGNRALVVGISDYPAPITKLPAVAGDVRAIAHLLQSKRGVFRKQGTVVLTESKATTAAILAAATDALSTTTTDTVFVYLAGHGDVDRGEYYFISHDTDKSNVAGTAVPLSEIKKLFDDCKSKRVFLWLDCCHSGGILKPRSSTTVNNESILKRTLQAVQGEGRVIIAACTAEQLAYEDHAIGHGVFTHALLRGLKGEAEAQGEVTATSLYDFIDREIGTSRQRPMFFGQTAGRIVLMHETAKRSSKRLRTNTTSAKGPTGQRISSSGNWILLGDQFFEARRVSQRANGSFEVSIATKDSAEDAAIRRLKPANNYGRTQAPFAHRNDACDVTIESMSSESTSKGHIWAIELLPLEPKNVVFSEMTYSDGHRRVTPEDIAEMRARFILFNETPPKADSARSLGFSLWDNAVTELDGKKIVPPVPAIYSRRAAKLSWRQMARLACIYLLKTTNTVEHVEDLSFGAATPNGVEISFRGVRARRYSNVDPGVIVCEGTCPLPAVTQSP